MNEANEILNNIDTVRFEPFELNLLPLLKIPLILLIIANLLFALILYFRIRILSDTFVTSQNRSVKSLVVIYLLGTFFFSLFAILFLVLS